MEDENVDSDLCLDFDDLGAMRITGMVVYERNAIPALRFFGTHAGTGAMVSVCFEMHERESLGLLDFGVAAAESAFCAQDDRFDNLMRSLNIEDLSAGEDEDNA